MSAEKQPKIKNLKKIFCLRLLNIALKVKENFAASS